MIAIFDQPIVPAFKIDPQPSSSQNLELAIDLLSQDRDSKQKGQDSCFLELSGLSSLRGGLSRLGLVSQRRCRTTTWY